MLGMHRWLRASLLMMLGIVLSACSSRDPEPAEPLDLRQPIAVDRAGQEAQFEFEMSARNFLPHRTYSLGLDLQRPTSNQSPVSQLNLPFSVSLERMTAGTWQELTTYDSYQAGVLRAGKTLPTWHVSEAWRYALLRSGSSGHYYFSIVALPVELDARYRLKVRTVQARPDLQEYSAQLVVHAARPVGK